MSSGPGIKGVKKVVLVLSGKGGVGKSTVSCQVGGTVCMHACRVVRVRAPVFV
jgi:Mrp family chromosome partitioning ATPase